MTLNQDQIRNTIVIAAEPFLIQSEIVAMADLALAKSVLEDLQVQDPTIEENLSNKLNSHSVLT